MFRGTWTVLLFGEPFWDSFGERPRPEEFSIVFPLTHCRRIHPPISIPQNDKFMAYCFNKSLVKRNLAWLLSGPRSGVSDPPVKNSGLSTGEQQPEKITHKSLLYL